MPLTIDGATAEFVTLAELKAHLNKTTTADDAELELFRTASEGHVEELVGPVLWREVQQSSKGRCSVVLNTLPILSVDTVGGVDLADTAYTADLESGIVEGLPRGQRLSVVYTAGRDACPDAIRLATLIVAKHLWETQRGRATNRAGSTAEGEQRVPSGYLIPHRAEALLRPYALMTGFA